MIRNAIFFFTMLTLLSGSGYAYEAEKLPPNETQSPPNGTVKVVVTEHSVEIDGKHIPYTATTGLMPYKNEKGEIKASFFYVAYVRNDIQNQSNRPVAFCFNGGPGASSVWLQMGLLGPKRVPINPAHPTSPPYNTVDNNFSLLDSVDLVFIDPISTGYSRATNPEDAKVFHNVDEDIKSIAEFIRLYTTNNGRWESPKLLIGESYGTMRAALLVEYLQEKMYMHLNGIIMVSSVLDYQTVDRSDRQNEMTYMLYLPSFTAAAWYHKKLPPDLLQDRDKALQESKAFAMGEYSQALLKGDQLSENEKSVINEKLVRYTGLPMYLVERMNQRISLFPFLKELLRNEKRLIGRFDSRVIGIDVDPCSNTFEYDPSLEIPIGAYTAAFNQYVRSNLNWISDEQYNPLADVYPWDFGKATNQYLNSTSSLRSAMSRNPALNVFVACGYYDLATPYFGAEYTFDHIFLDPSLKSQVYMHYYDGGHMMFTDTDALPKLSSDLHQFVEKLAIPDA